ncbi:MAG: DNA polymerase III subunit delta' [Chloroflexi bacterium]|uniref:DNA polymerase III subunit delta n=1 Tax=Candidatus Chlorohelix allophototropha TaxID=3003348 RepID=A0A8T7M9U8_9CHLR|nr:DNA polymerase III subunit delta' [Chloroflexota bacterium]WJW68776.1 DNA polymerase III subunit delta' [Chloroflexota bacterium L227-S17]
MIGHGWAVSFLQNCIDTEKVTHAYLLRGPAGVGKFRLALDFALALGCENPPAKKYGLRYCGECRPCRLIEENKHSDVTVLGLEWQTRSEGVKEGNAGQNLKIDSVRYISHEVSRPPHEIGWRVIIIRDAETMQTAAANAFLKTLEEPPDRAVLILLADSDRPMLPTIVSRCQIIELRPVPREEIARSLLSEGASKNEAHMLAALSAGRPGWALEEYRDTTKQRINDRDEALMHLEELLPADRVKRLSFADTLTARWQSGGNKRTSVLVMLNIWLGWWRDLALVRQNLPAHISNVDKLDTLKEQAGRFSPIQIKDMLLGITHAQAELEANVMPRLALGDLFINKLPKA